MSSRFSQSINIISALIILGLGIPLIAVIWFGGGIDVGKIIHAYRTEAYMEQLSRSLEPLCAEENFQCSLKVSAIVRDDAFLPQDRQYSDFHIFISFDSLFPGSLPQVNEQVNSDKWERSTAWPQYQSQRKF